MITYQYTQKDWTTFKEGIKREWAVTNGIGGYAGSSMIGAYSRTHQGYLIASLHAPIERYLVFSKINETATVGTSTVSFETSQHCASGKSVYTGTATVPLRAHRFSTTASTVRAAPRTL